MSNYARNIFNYLSICKYSKWDKNIVVHVYVKKLFDQFAVKEDSLKHTLSSLRNTPIGLQKWYSSQRFGIQTVSQSQVMLYLYHF